MIPRAGVHRRKSRCQLAEPLNYAIAGAAVHLQQASGKYSCPARSLTLRAGGVRFPQTTHEYSCLEPIPEEGRNMSGRKNEK